MAQEPVVYPNKSLNSIYLFLLVEFMLHPTATFNTLLKLSEHTGKASRETAAAIFQEMLHVGIGKFPSSNVGAGLGYMCH